MKQLVIMVVFLFLFSNSFLTQVNALQKAIGVGGGVSMFSDYYSTDGNIMVKMQLQSYNGVSIDLNGGYIRSNGKTTANPDLSMIPLLIGVTYTYKNPFSTFEPYMGLLAGASVMNDSFESPLLTYGGRVGLDVRMDHSLLLFLEAQYLRLNDSKNNLDISPLNFAMGIKLVFGRDRIGPRVGKQASRRNLKRRQQNRYQRR